MTSAHKRGGWGGGGGGGDRKEGYQSHDVNIISDLQCFLPEERGF